jgi:hypothetical protein
LEEARRELADMESSAEEMATMSATLAKAFLSMYNHDDRSELTSITLDMWPSSSDWKSYLQFVALLIPMGCWKNIQDPMDGILVKKMKAILHPDKSNSLSEFLSKEDKIRLSPIFNSSVDAAKAYITRRRHRVGKAAWGQNVRASRAVYVRVQTSACGQVIRAWLVRNRSP